MQVSLRDAVRARVDEMRSNASLRVLDAENIAEILRNGIATDVEGPAVEDRADHAGTPHFCPWHTCAATRHG